MKNQLFPKAIILLSIIILICNFTPSTTVEFLYNADLKSANNDFYFNIAAQKFEFLESEPIWITADIILNNSMKLDYKPALDPSNDLKLILLNSKGDTLKYKGIIITSLMKKEYSDTMFFIGNLLDYFGEYEVASKSALLRYYLPSDQYVLTAYLYLNINGKKRVFKSNEIAFKVNHPSGKELDAYNELLEIRIKYRWGLLEELLKFTESVESFVNKYPNSIYVDEARYLVTLMGKLPEDKISFFKNLIAYNPNSGYVESYLYNLHYFYDEENKNSQFKEYLENLKKSEKNTLVEKIIKNKIFD